MYCVRKLRRHTTATHENLNQTIQTAGGPRDVAGISSQAGTVNGSERPEISTNSREISTELKDTNTSG
jgi:hypothetical protein